MSGKRSRYVYSGTPRLHASKIAFRISADSGCSPSAHESIPSPWPACLPGVIATPPSTSTAPPPESRPRPRLIRVPSSLRSFRPPVVSRTRDRRFAPARRHARPTVNVCESEPIPDRLFVSRLAAGHALPRCRMSASAPPVEAVGAGGGEHHPNCQMSSNDSATRSFSFGGRRLNGDKRKS